MQLYLIIGEGPEGDDGDRLFVKHADARRVIDGLQALLNERDDKLARYAEFLAWCESAPVGSGVCCCGDHMDGHGHYADHGAVDEWDHSLGNWATELRK